MKLALWLFVWLASASAAYSAPCSPIRWIEFQGSPFANLASRAPAMGIEELAQTFGNEATSLISAYEAKTALAKVARIVGPGAEPEDGACVVLLRLTPDDGLPEQAFRYRSAMNEVEITGGAIGLLYGVYDFLDRVGFKWYAPEGPWEIVPDALNWPATIPQETIPPSAAFRGVRTDDGATIPNSYLIWMARNRFNLIGLSGADATLASALGIKLEAGGHNLISEILSGDRVVAGSKLADVHSDWYGQGSAPIKLGSDVYDNPCFAADGLAEFFANELADRILGGDLSDASIIDVWPSDQTTLSLAKSCQKPWPEAGDVDQLFQFYGTVLGVLNDRLRREMPSRKIRVAGISYYDMWAPPDTRILPRLANLSNVEYIHVLYVNERTYSQPLVPSSDGINKRIYNAMRDWASRLSDGGVKIGVCDYYNYSIYNSLPATFASTLPADHEAYHEIGVDLLTYMHPIGGDPGPRRLTEALRSRLPWGDEPEKVIDEYFSSAFAEHSADVRREYEKFDRALSNMAEMWGPVGGLTQMLGQRVYWADPPLSVDAIRASIDAYLDGGAQQLPDVRKTHFSPSESTFVGLTEAVDLLDEVLKAKLVAARSEGDINRRIQIDAEWVEFAQLQYHILSAAAVAMKAGDDASSLKQKIAPYIERLKEVDKFNRMLSPLDQRKIFYDTVSVLERSVETPSWGDEIIGWMQWMKKKLRSMAYWMVP